MPEVVKYSAHNEIEFTPYDETTELKPSFYFKKDQKLRLNKEYEEVFKNGVRVRSSLLCLIILRNSPSTKIGIVVRKKEYHDAVSRNKIKRKIRELARLHYPYISKNVWIVIQTYKNIDKVTWQQLKDEFINLCMKAELMI